MSTPTPYSSPQGFVEPPRREPHNGLGTSGFIVGLIGLIFAFIPIIGVVAWPLVILGLVFSLIGFVRASRGKATNKGLSIAGVVVSAVGLVICIIWLGTVGTTVNEVDKEANREVAVHYEVTGDAPNATISYTTYGDGNTSMSEENVTDLPWSKDLTTKGLFKGGSLTVMTGAEGGSVTCTVTIDGGEAKTSTASGQYATASCDGFGG